MNRELHVIFGTGPLGRSTAEVLLDMGKRVRLVSRAGAMHEAPAGAELCKADALDSTASYRLVEGATTVYQCAQPAYHRWTEEFPALQTAILDMAARAGAAMVAAENLYMYGRPGGQVLTESTPWAPCSRKGHVRAAMSQQFFAAHAAGHARVASVRGSDFFGPWDMIQGSHLFGAALRGKAVQLIGRTDQPHTFTWTRDFGRALATVGTRPDALGRAWHVPSGDPVTQADLVRMVGQALGRPVASMAAGRFMLGLAGLFSPAAGELVEMLYEFNEPFVMDGSAMEQQFGLRATPMTQRISETLAWARKALACGWLP